MNFFPIFEVRNPGILFEQAQSSMDCVEPLGIFYPVNGKPVPKGLDFAAAQFIFRNMREIRPEELFKRGNDNWVRIKAVIDHYNFPSVAAFARHLGLKRAENLYQIKKGNNHISRALAEKICTRFPAVSKAWLMTGENQMMIDRQPRR